MRDILNILNEKTLADVGVRANRMYVAIQSYRLSDTFFNDGILTGLKGVSSSKNIWQEFGPDKGCDMFIIMKADEVLKMNRLKRIQYHNATQLLANQSELAARILDADVVGKLSAETLIRGIYQKMHIDVEWHSMWRTISSIVTGHKRGIVISTNFPDYNLSSADDYRQLFYAAACLIDEPYLIRYFAPQRASKVNKEIEKAVEEAVAEFGLEQEWVVERDPFIVPPSSKILLSVDLENEGVDPEMEKLLKAARLGKFEYKVLDEDQTVKGLRIASVRRA